ncbi:aromatic amino acid lyase [Rossellomorea aquimaris]|uniref:aromatic amino acid lyase n=1 Tax=Rossellomorea aquimaris TaxID=189382 RepID=UPI001CD20966|nr:aromatic amino acid lyase [Rossellomorea aquimaris]MCA1053846.1 aromatic amino acid lyase [Rossellomorea aquimaris]
MKKQTLHQLLTHIENSEIPEDWVKSVKLLEKEYNQIKHVINRPNPPRIYGLNTLVGHLDDQDLSHDSLISFQNELINNHSIGINEFYDPFIVRCINYAKVQSISMGGTGISPDLFKRIIHLLEEGFIPRVPRLSSYSCGDVIPGAHWASEVLCNLNLRKKYTLKPKEGLSLINGNFVHIGYSVAISSQMLKLFKRIILNSFKVIALSKSNPSNFKFIVNQTSNPYLRETFKTMMKFSNQQKGIYNVQDPVSVRSIPQMIEALLNGLSQWKQSIEVQLNQSSDNPLFDRKDEAFYSQSSFLALDVSLQASKLIETILMVCWNIERRIHYLLSGRINNIPQNGASEDEHLGFIQLPKLVTAMVEEVRMKVGRRTFASGSSTSYGIEDFWSYGVINNNQLEELIKTTNKILEIEENLIDKLNDKFNVVKTKELYEAIEELDSIEFNYKNI